VAAAGSGDQREFVRLHDLGQPVQLRQAQLDFLPVVVDEPDPLSVVIMILVDHDLRCGVMFGHTALLQFAPGGNR